MKPIEAIKNSAWLRLGILVVLIVILIWAFGLTPRERQTMGLVVAAKLGMIAPALILGAAWGWIRFSRSQWGWATAVLLVGTFAAVYWGESLNEHYKALGERDPQATVRGPEAMVCKTAPKASDGKYIECY